MTTTPLSRRRRIVVVGDICTDVVTRFTGGLHWGSDSPAAVETHGGGSAANVAAWLATYTDAPAIYVGRIGSDAAGTAQSVDLRAAGVDVRVATDQDRATGCVVVLVTADGERTMLPDRGANAWLSPDDLPRDVFVSGSHLHLSGYPLLHETSRAAGIAALALARDAGMTVSVDPSSRAPLEIAGGDRFLEWTRGAHLCIANLDEAEVLVGGGSPAEVACRLASSAYPEVVVKLGRDGAVWSDGSEVVQVAAVAATVVDTTGAGDAFAAGFLTVWTTGGAPLAALAEAARLGAVAVATRGGRPPR